MLCCYIVVEYLSLDGVGRSRITAELSHCDIFAADLCISTMPRTIALCLLSTRTVATTPSVIALRRSQDLGLWCSVKLTNSTALPGQPSSFSLLIAQDRGIAEGV